MARQFSRSLRDFSRRRLSVMSGQKGRRFFPAHLTAFVAVETAR